MTLSLIALFAYNRPADLKRVLGALAHNPEASASRLFIFSDAPRSAAAAQVLVEALDFSLEHAAQHPLHSYMTRVDYELVAKTMNTLFFRNAR